MATDRLDIVIFGATGFTGRFAVKNMFQMNKKYPELKWAVAGRSKTKLDALLQDMKTAGEDTSNIAVIVADVSDDASMLAMCVRARAIVNCCGPYRFYGEAVVRAAVRGGSHHVDVSGEPQFIESMQLKYDEQAKSAGVYIVSACGFDSVPNDMGVIFLKQHFDGGVLNQVESYLSSEVDPSVKEEASRTGLIHYGTWESLVYGLAYHGEIKQIRKQLYPKPLPAFKPKLQPKILHRNNSRWCLPFLGSDKSIVYRTQRYYYTQMNERYIQFRPYFKTRNVFYAVFAIFAGVLLFLMSKVSFTRSLLLKYPRLFSFGIVTREGPSERVAENCTTKFLLVGRGWEKGTDVDKEEMNKEVKVKVTCKNPGYGMTSTSLLLCAITLLQETDKIPGTGGVLTTGTAFANTDLINRLIDSDVKFEVIESIKGAENTDKSKSE